MSLEGTTSRWIDDLDPDEGEERAGTSQGWRPRLLLLAASIPWLLVIALLVIPSRLGEDDDVGAEVGSGQLSTGSSSPDPIGSDEDAVVSASPGGGEPPGELGMDDATSAPPDGLAELDLMEVRGAWRVEPGPEEAAALGIVIARSWLTTLDPPLEVEGMSTSEGHRYAEHLVVEAVERPTADAAVVTVLAVVLEGDPTLEARVRRLAVPIVWDAHVPRAGGPPWDLPPPDLTAHPLSTSEPVDDIDDGAALAALQAAGYLEVELLGLRSSDAGIVVAEVRARTTDGTTVDGQVWLRRHLDGLVVAGTTLAGGDGS